VIWISLHCIIFDCIFRSTNRGNNHIDRLDCIFRSANRGNNHIDRLEQDVDEVTHLLKNNVEKVLERGDKLEDLQDRSGTNQIKKKTDNFFIYFILLMVYGV
jgi:hypothetical protein